MATKKEREERISALVASGAEALAAQVVDLQDQNEEASGKLGDLSKLRAENKEYKRINKDQAAMLTALGKLSPLASPLAKHNGRYARIAKDNVIIDGESYTAKQIAESPALVKKLADRKSPVLVFADEEEEEEGNEETNA